MRFANTVTSFWLVSVVSGVYLSALFYYFRRRCLKQITLVPGVVENTLLFPTCLVPTYLFPISFTFHIFPCLASYFFIGCGHLLSHNLSTLNLSHFPTPSRDMFQISVAIPTAGSSFPFLLPLHHTPTRAHYLSIQQ